MTQAHRPLVTAAILAATILPLGVVGPRSARAQATVSGAVFDSVGRVMLAGAVVQLVRGHDAGAPIAYTTQTDSAGRFVIPGVLPGKYFAGFMHPTLDSLGIEPILRSLDVAAGAKTARLALAVPSPITIAVALCGPGARSDSVGTVFGRLYDAETLRPVPGAVSLRWTEITISAAGANQRTPEVRASTDADGSFAFCNAPSDALVGLRGVRGQDTTGTVELELPLGRIVRRNLFVGSVTTTTRADTVVLGDSTRTTIPRVLRRGSARLSGTVRTKEGRALPGARIGVVESGVEATSDADGRFLLTGAPAGTQRLEVRAIGYYPEQRTVDLVARRPVTLDVTLATLRSVLDTVRIMASRAYSTDRNGFERRRRGAATGRFFDQNDVQRLRPHGITQLLDRVHGVSVSGRGFDTPILMRGFYSGAYCQPMVYIDGLRMPDLSASEIDMWVRPDELAGMEVYPRAGQAPPQFSNLDGCGSVVLWTQRPLPRRKR